MFTRTPGSSLLVLSLGAGVQSTALALLAEEGTLPKPDVAIFADTGWEPKNVYDHLSRLEAAVSYPIHKVQQGNIYDESISPDYGNRLPLFTRDENGKLGRTMRTCTPHFKVRPIQDETRRLLGAKVSERECRFCKGTGTRVTPWSIKAGEPREGTCSVCHGTGLLRKIGSVPKGALADQWIGFSTDEIGRVAPSRVPYVKSHFPLLDLGMSRMDCLSWMRERGWTSVAKSACVACPFHGNAAWRDLRDNHPDEWQEAVEFDRKLREPGVVPLKANVYVHRSGVPLDQADISKVTPKEAAEAEEMARIEEGDPDGCSPYACRSGEAV